MVFEGSWGHLGGILGASWGILEPLGSILGASWEHLGGILGHLGSILGIKKAKKSKMMVSPRRDANFYKPILTSEREAPVFL